MPDINRITPTGQTDFTPQTASVSKKAITPYTADTLATSTAQTQTVTRLPKLEKPAAGNPYKAVEEALNELYQAPSYSITNPENEDLISKRPRGSNQPQLDLSGLNQFKTDLEDKKKVINPAEKSDTRPSQGELERLMLQYYRLQSELEEGYAKLFTSELKLQESQQDNLNEVYSNLNQDLEERRKNSELLDWINISSTCAVVAAAFAVYMTGGTSTLLNFGLSAASITSGISSASKAVIDHNKDLKTGELYDINSQKKQLDRLIGEKTETLTNTAQQLLDIATMMREILEKQSEATRIIFS